MKKILHFLALFVLITSLTDAKDDFPVKTIDGTENLPQPVKIMLYEEQTLHNIDLLKNKFSAESFKNDVDPKYAPTNRPKFPLPYFLIPQDESIFLRAQNLNQVVLDQISMMEKDGRRYFKLFVHPESLSHYEILNGVYEFVGENATEFMASPTSSFRSLVVWKQSGEQSTPFIAKVSLDRDILSSINRLVSRKEVIRSIANQEALNKIGPSKLAAMNLKYFPETAGLLISNSSIRSEKLGGQIIREIPHEVLTGEKRWISWSALTSPLKRDRMFILDVIRKNKMSPLEFIDKVMIESYMKMFDEVSFGLSMNFEPHGQNLCLELDSSGKATGKWVLRDFGGMLPDILSMIRNGGPVDVYMKEGNAITLKMKEAVSDHVSSYLYFYKNQVFDVVVGELSKVDPSISKAVVANLNDKINKRFVDLVNLKFKTNLTVNDLPSSKNHRKLKYSLSNRIPFNGIEGAVEIGKDQNVKGLIRKKVLAGEWTELKSNGLWDRFYYTDHALFRVRDDTIVGFGLFTEAESKMLSTTRNLQALIPKDEGNICVRLLKRVLLGY